MSGEPTMEMPRYQCHKKVWALKIARIEPHGDGSGTIYPADEGYGIVPVSGVWMTRHLPHTDMSQYVGGYYVVYDDGYASYSPQAAFEAGYTRI